MIMYKKHMYSYQEHIATAVPVTYVATYFIALLYLERKILWIIQKTVPISYSLVVTNQL